MPGARLLEVGVSQLFRATDLVVFPEKVCHGGLQRVISSRDGMRRALNSRKPLPLGDLGELRPVARVDDRFEQFWRVGVPDLRVPTSGHLYFLPFQLSLDRRLSGLAYEPDSILRESLAPVEAVTRNRQVTGRLRIYPPGVGVVSLRLVLQFKQAIDPRPLRQLIRNVEDLLFVDAAGSRQPEPAQKLLLGIVEQVSEELFGPEGSLQDARFRPPETVLKLQQIEGRVAAELAPPLARLMAVAPRNAEDHETLRRRLERALGSPAWERDRVLGVAGEGVTLLAAAATSEHRRADSRKKLLAWLAETSDLVSAIVYAEQALIERIAELAEEPGQALASPAYAIAVLGSLLQVRRAARASRRHLKNLGPGLLLNFARDVWRYDNPIEERALERGLGRLEAAFAEPAAATADPQGTAVRELARELREIGHVFAPPARPARRGAAAPGDAPPRPLEAARRARVFVSYRSEDTATTASRLSAELVEALGSEAVFYNENLAGGVEWPEELRRGVRQASVLLALIGGGWLSAQDRETGQRRLDDPADWVRLEIETAFAHGIAVLPVLVDGAKPPSQHALAALPSLQRLASLQAVQLRTKDWQGDLDRLVAQIARHPAAGQSEAAP